MYFLQPKTQAYPWGSRSLIAKLRGQTTESEYPEAELWYGAHPALPSDVDDTTLEQLIAADPDYHLGSEINQRFAGRLPFLLKILAAGQPLSLQAHPSKQQAEEGFARENAAGIDLRAPNRNYRDDNHKPELLVALTEFRAMAGFRPLHEISAVLTALSTPEVDRYAAMLDPEADDTAAQLRALFTTWITIPTAARKSLLEQLVAKCHEIREHSADYPEWIVQTVTNIIQLNHYYPGDTGILGALLLHYIVLQPGEALYLDAGNLHAYCSGLGVEIMANSDNVLRGGLTTKHIDVPELVKVLSFEPLEDPRLHATQSQFLVPNEEFQLRMLEVLEETTYEIPGPRILVATAGAVQVTHEQETVVLHPTQALWLPAGSPAAFTLSGTGQVFLAGCGSTHNS